MPVCDVSLLLNWQVELSYRARWYDPQQGRFITEDPIRFDGGMNFYAYVGNEPVSRIDSSGHGWRKRYAKYNVTGKRGDTRDVVYYEWSDNYRWSEGDPNGVPNGYAYVDVNGNMITFYGDERKPKSKGYNHSWGYWDPHCDWGDITEANSTKAPPPAFARYADTVEALEKAGYEYFLDVMPEHWGGVDFAQKTSPAFHVTLFISSEDHTLINPTIGTINPDAKITNVTVHTDPHSPITQTWTHIWKDTIRQYLPW